MGSADTTSQLTALPQLVLDPRQFDPLIDTAEARTGPDLHRWQDPVVGSASSRTLLPREHSCAASPRTADAHSGRSGTAGGATPLSLEGWCWSSFDSLVEEPKGPPASCGVRRNGKANERCRAAGNPPFDHGRRSHEPPGASGHRGNCSAGPPAAGESASRLDITGSHTNAPPKRGSHGLVLGFSAASYRSHLAGFRDPVTDFAYRGF